MLELQSQLSGEGGLPPWTSHPFISKATRERQTTIYIHTQAHLRPVWRSHLASYSNSLFKQKQRKSLIHYEVQKKRITISIN